MLLNFPRNHRQVHRILLATVHVVHTVYPAWSLTDYDSHVHGCLTLPYGQQADMCLPEHSVVYIVTPFSLR